MSWAEGWSTRWLDRQPDRTITPASSCNMWRNPGETGLDANGQDKATNGIDDDGDGYVDDVYGINPGGHNSDPMPSGLHGYHGTACAGIIGAVGNNTLGIAGVNWSVRMMALRWGDSLTFRLRGVLSAVLESFEYVIQQRRRGVNVRVTSNSYGAPFYSQSLKDAIDVAGGEGVLTVCAAGNAAVSTDTSSFAPASPFTPASLDSPYILSVAASD